MKRLINDQWLFAEFKADTSYEDCISILSNEDSANLSLLSSPLSSVDLPHDYMIFNTHALYRSSIGFYRRELELDATKHNAVYFEGVYMNTSVYLNGEKICFWPYGYSSFEVDLTPYQVPGKNTLEVYVHYKEPNTRWYSGAGIYRDVYLLTKEATRLATDGIYVSSIPANEANFKTTIDTEIIASSSPVVTVKHTITNADNEIIATSSQELSITDSKAVDSQEILVPSVTRWDIENPYLYTLTTELICENTCIDSFTQKIGFRTIKFDPNTGFYLNDKSVKIHGACMHHDHGALGSAFNVNAMRRQMLKLKNIGINSIRTSHNMPAKALMYLADELGMLIDSEAFDMWEKNKTTNDYGTYFHEWCEIDVASWVRRDRNHASLIMWSIGNEIPDTNDPGSEEIAKRLCNAVRANDYRHNGYTTIGSNYVAWEQAQKCSDVVELSGYNYLESVYEDHHNNKFPHWCIYGSETSSTVASRGIYHFPKSNKMLTYADEQCSSLDNCTTNWGAKSNHKAITDDRDAKYCFGQYIWTGWDYIGEPTPYFNKNSYFGQIDTAGFYKDTAYIYKAGWVPMEKDPFVHIAPYWDFNNGQIIDVNLHSNCKKVELYFNNELIGSKCLDQEKDLDFSASFSLPYSEGTLTAKAYDENGTLLATDETCTFGDPVEVSLKPEALTCRADGEDLIYVEINVLDKNGLEVRNARNRINVTVAGEGRLIGLDNGDSTDWEQYKCASRKLFSGKLIAIIAATKVAGEIKVCASSAGLESAELTLNSIPAIAREGVACNYRIEPSQPCDEIPVRKIELVKHGNNLLGPDNTSVKVSANILPANASYTNISFKAVTLEGIEANFVKVTQNGNEATIEALGDGEFRLIAASNNDKNHFEVMSELEFSVDGLGNANFNPYDMVHGCQYSSVDNEAILSFQGGINLKNDNTTITYSNVDFGEYGSDELTVAIFTFRDEAPVEIWEGEPDNSELLFKGMYAIPTQYNVLQENTFKLSKRIKGVNSITFRFPWGLVFGYFKMTYLEKAYGLLNATEHNNMNGDSYDIREDGIYNIGNNVDIEFLHMNFTDGIKSITITGRSNVDVNPVHVRFKGESGDVNQICSFTYSEEIQTITFPLENVTGENKVNIIFMPGSNFDLISFKFNK